jgi:hypothetical protein
MSKQEVSNKHKVIYRVNNEVVKKIIESGEFKSIVCNYKFTGNFGYDAVLNFKKGKCSRKYALKVAEDWLHTDYGKTYCYIDTDFPDQIIIMPYLNLSYTLFLNESAFTYLIDNDMITSASSRDVYRDKRNTRWVKSKSLWNVLFEGNQKIRSILSPILLITGVLYVWFA